ncbi:MAG: hypothetical protein ACJAS1_003418 [Oleiphilaceae bacterium]|jgi:hypothetical protein
MINILLILANKAHLTTASLNLIKKLPSNLDFNAMKRLLSHLFLHIKYQPITPNRESNNIYA